MFLERNGNDNFTDCCLSALQYRVHPHVLTNLNSPWIQLKLVKGSHSKSYAWFDTGCSVINTKTKDNSEISLLYHGFSVSPQRQSSGSWYSRGMTAEVHNTEKYNMLFPKRNIWNQKLNTWSFTVISLAEGKREPSAILIALPPHLSLALCNCTNPTVSQVIL